MIDENAYGLLISYLTADDDEYALEASLFAQRLEGFRVLVREQISHSTLASDLSVWDFGTFFYLEVAEGDERQDPFRWLASTRERLTSAEYPTVGVLTHGGRWVGEDDAERLPRLDSAPGVTYCRCTHSSEPFRRALYAECAAHDSEESPGWGPGLYVDAEAVEALGRKLKNVPTPLVSADATFYRIGG